MKNFGWVKYSKISGEVLIIANFPVEVASILPPLGEDEGYLIFDHEGTDADHGNCYVDTEAMENAVFPTPFPSYDLLLARPSMGLPSVVQFDLGGAAVVPGLPEPCTVTLEEETYAVDDGELDLSGATAGEYSLRIDAFPYLPHTLKVIINEASSE